MADALTDVEASFYSALNALLNGESGRLKALISRADDATAFLSFGGYEKGWHDLDERWEWARSVFAGGKLEPELLSRHVAGDLTVAVFLERGDVKYASNPSKAARMELRSTNVFRREGGSWKLVHRHADDLRPRKQP